MYLSKLLEQQGNPGMVDFSGDYSTVPIIGEIKAQAGKIMAIHHMHILVGDDGGAAGFGANDYGNINGGLPNGLSFTLNNDAGLIFQLSPAPVKKNADYSLFAQNVKIIDWGIGNDYLAVQHDFAASGQPLILTGTERLEILFQDDFTSINGGGHHVYFTGQIADDNRQNRQRMDDQYMLEWSEHDEG